MRYKVRFAQGASALRVIFFFYTYTRIRLFNNLAAVAECMIKGWMVGRLQTCFANWANITIVFTRRKIPRWAAFLSCCFCFAWFFFFWRWRYVGIILIMFFFCGGEGRVVESAWSAQLRSERAWVCAHASILRLRAMRGGRLYFLWFCTQRPPPFAKRIIVVAHCARSHNNHTLSS